jgi:hypothetical protein
MLKILILQDSTLLKEIEPDGGTVTNDITAYLKMTKINVGGFTMDITNKIMINDIKGQPRYLTIYVK